MLFRSTLGATGSVLATSSVLTVPSLFGTDPFLDPRFAIAPTLYRVPASGEHTQGVWYDPTIPRATNFVGRLNELIEVPQHLLSISPENSDGTGRNFRIRVKSLEMFPNGVVDNMSRLGARLGNREVIGDFWAMEGDNWTSSFVHGRPLQSSYRSFWSTPYWSCAACSELSNNAQSGCVTADMDVAANMAFEFTPIYWELINVERNECPNSVGFALRMDSTGANFYGLLIGDRPRYNEGSDTIVNQGSYSAKIVRATDLDYSQIRGNGTVIDDEQLVQFGSEFFLTLGLSYKLELIGNTFTVYEGWPGSWTQITQVTVSGGPSTGKAGVYAIARDGASCRVHFFTNLSAYEIPPTSSYNNQYKVNLLYAFSGRSNGIWSGPDHAGAGGIAIDTYTPRAAYDLLIRGWNYDATDSPVTYTGYGDEYGVQMMNEVDPGTSVQVRTGFILKIGQYGGDIDISRATHVNVNFAPLGTGSPAIVQTVPSTVKFGVSSSATAAEESDFTFFGTPTILPAGSGIYSVIWTIPDNISTDFLKNIRSIYVEGAILQSAAPAGLLVSPISFQRN